MHIPPFLLERYFAPYEFSIRHLLCASDCETTTARSLLDLVPGALDRLLDAPLHYSLPEGRTELRRAVAARYESIEPDDVLITTGGGSAIEAASHALFGPGDRVVVVTPSYQSFAEWPRLLGSEVIAFPLTDTGTEWTLDLDALDELLDRQPTAGLVFDCPNNPTGHLPTRDAFDRLFEIARRHGTRVVCDEIFRELEHDEVDRLPAAADLDPTAVSLGGVSKSFGLPGLRIGWIVARDRPLFERMAAVLDYTTKDASAPSQMLATIAVEHADELLATNRALMMANKERLAACVRRHADVMRLNMPRAGVVAYPRLARVVDAEAFAQNLIDDGVLVLPGSVFEQDPHYFRVGFGRRDFAPGLEILSRHLAGCAAAVQAAT